MDDTIEAMRADEFDCIILAILKQRPDPILLRKLKYHTTKTELAELYLALKLP